MQLVEDNLLRENDCYVTDFALGIGADTGQVAKASRWVSGRVVQYERIARAEGNAINIGRRIAFFFLSRNL